MPHQACQLFLALHAAIMHAAACIHRFQLRIERLTGYPFIGYRDTQFHITPLAQSAIFSRPSSISLCPSLGIGRINMHKMLMGEKYAREREKERCWCCLIFCIVGFSSAIFQFHEASLVKNSKLWGWNA